MTTGVQETLRIATPEGVSLELSLAGLGSRFVALLADTFLQGVALALLIVALVVADADGFAFGAVVARGDLRAALRLPGGLRAGGRRAHARASAGAACAWSATTARR